MTKASCKDCEPGSKRPAPHPGPRCSSHHRVVVKARKAAAHEVRVQKVYGIGPGDYGRLLEIQGGVCALCRRARGIAKRLAVDHDHATGAVRGLLCTPCNRGVLGHSRDDPEFFRRAIAYLENPPANRLGDAE